MMTFSSSYVPVDIAEQQRRGQHNQREPSSLYTKLWSNPLDSMIRSTEAFFESTDARRRYQVHYSNPSVYNPANPRYSNHFEEHHCEADEKNMDIEEDAPIEMAESEELNFVNSSSFARARKWDAAFDIPFSTHGNEKRARFE